MATTTTAVAAPPTGVGVSTLCAATTTLPANAVLYLGDGWEPYTLTQQAVYEVACPTVVVSPTATTTEPAGRVLEARDASSTYTSTPLADSSLSSSDDSDSTHHFSDFRDPFYATQFPMCYALAATTITAYMLVIILFVTPRTFVDGGTLRLGGRGALTGRGTGAEKIGGRPWLQKLAALTVAISLTVATGDTFRVAQQQYSWGIQNAKTMQQEVIGSNELKAIRLISDTFLWLAQAQTLIRLFPRQREKVLIKWVAFALITLDFIFTALNSWKYSDDGVSAPSSFVHPVPALSYLFQLALGILYAVWVIYYSFTKRRYAYYHPAMRNICLIAIMATASVLIPIVFFILDISKPGFTGWGDYVRWVGAAAASVVVWEWVERIEALERDEKRDGILGREVFDGDDTLEVNASEFPWLRKHREGRRGDDGGETGREASHHMGPHEVRGGSGAPGARGSSDNQAGQPRMSMTAVGNMLRSPMWPSRPAPVATPVSRTDTGSAASTVYAVRYPPPSDTTNRTPDPITQQMTGAGDLVRQNSLAQSQGTADEGTVSSYNNNHRHSPPYNNIYNHDAPASVSQNGYTVASNTPPPPPSTSHQQEQQQQQQQQDDQESSPHAHELHESSLSPGRNRASGTRWAVRARLEVFAANQAERLRERMRPTNDTDSLPVTVIPAPARQGTALQQVLEEEGETTGGSRTRTRSRSRSRSRSHSPSSPRRDRSTDRADGLPADQPPLWPGVQSRLMYGDDDYSSYDGDSVTDTLSTGDGTSRP